MKYYIWLFLLAMFSCQKAQKKEDSYETLLLGDWIELTETQLAKRDTIWLTEDSLEIAMPEHVPLPPSHSLIDLYEPVGLGIYKDSLDYFKGFVQITDDSTAKGYSIRYLGNFTHYQLNKDTLKLFHKVKNTYQTLLIKKLVPDTLILQDNDSIPITFLKLPAIKDSLPLFDRIIFSTFCYSCSSVMSISIASNGEMVFHGEGRIDKQGFYRGRLSKAYTSYVFEKFRKANIKNLDTSYYHDNFISSHPYVTTTSLMNDGSIYKTVVDSDMAAPEQLVWAYIPAFFAYQTTKLDKIAEENLPFYQHLDYFDFIKKDSILNIEKTEAFVLWQELGLAKPTSKDFTPTYQVSFNYFQDIEASKNSYQVTAIKSDGRFYRFYIQKKVLLTLDLGYNFIEKNLKHRKIRAMEKWEK